MATSHLTVAGETVDPLLTGAVVPETGALDADPGVQLLDGAVSHEPSISSDSRRARAIASDIDRPLFERVEAFEDIFDTEVGDTDLVRLRHVEREFDIRQLHIKFEGSNPSGTQKDRIAFGQVSDALRRGFDAITVATCGNYGVALAVASSMVGLRCIVHIPAGSHTRRIRAMEVNQAEIVRVPGDYETAVQASSELATRDEIYDANPGGANTPLQLQLYGQIAYEIYDELRDAPAIVAVPVSNGTTLAGIYRGFLSLYRRGRTSRVPRMVAGSAWGKNPIVQSFVKKLPTCMDLTASKIHETAVNEPLVNWHSFDGDLALDAVRESGGWAGYTSDRKMLQSTKLIRDMDGFTVLPASTAGLWALLDRHRKSPVPRDRYVVVITGKRS